MINQSKLQGDAIPAPESAPDGVIVSPDTHRTRRLPPGQSRTKKWPVLDAYGEPRIDTAKWRMEISGLVNEPAYRTIGQELERAPREPTFGAT